MSSKVKEIVGFEFQEILLGEARNAVIAGDGNYAELKSKLLETLPGLAPDKAFAFGLPKGREVAEDQRRGICLTLNAALKKANLGWRVTYSGMKRVFICMPKAVKANAESSYVPRSKQNNIDDEPIIKMRQSGMSVSMISSKLPAIPFEHIKYVCYQVMTGVKRKTGAIRTTAPSDPGRVKAFMDIAMDLFKISDPKARRLGARRFRKVASVVGVKVLGLKPGSLASYLGITGDGVYFNAKNKNKNYLDEIQKLTEAVKGDK